MAGTSGLSTGRLGATRQIGSTAGLLGREADRLRKKGYEAASAKLALASSEARVRGQQGIQSADSRMAEEDYLDRLEQGLLRSQARGMFSGQAQGQPTPQSQGQPAAPAPGTSTTGVPRLLARPEAGGIVDEGTPAMLAKDDVADRRQAERSDILSRVRAESAADPKSTRESILARMNRERLDEGKAPINIDSKEFAAKDRADRESELESRRGAAQAAVRARTGPPVPPPALAGPPTPPPAVGPPVPPVRPLTQPSAVSHQNRLRARSVLQPRREIDAANRGVTNPADVRFENPLTAMRTRFQEEQRLSPKTPLRSAGLAYGSLLKAYGRNLTQTY